MLDAYITAQCVPYSSGICRQGCCSAQGVRLIDRLQVCTRVGQPETVWMSMPSKHRFPQSHTHTTHCLVQARRVNFVSTVGGQITVSNHRALA
jgi:hypothetical protein